FYCLIGYIYSNSPKWLYGGALSVATGFLNKYTVCFLIAGFLAALLISKQRILFKQAVFYKSIGILFLLILPNLLWQYFHDFPVIVHMQELTGRQLIHVDRIAFLKEQLLFFFPSFFIILSGMIGLIVYKPFIPYRIIGYNYLITLSLFLCLQGKAYYTIGLYPVWIALGVVFLEYLLQEGWKYYFRYVAAGFGILTGVLFIGVTCPVFSPDRIREDIQIQTFYKKTGQTVWEDGKDHGIPQDYADMTGWKELADLTGKALSILSEPERRSVFILCNDYGHAGAINYYLGPVPAVGSFSADYRNWFPEKAYELQSLIWVGAKYEQVEETFALSGLPFRSVRLIGSIQNPLSREVGTTVYLLTNPTICFTTDDLYLLGKAENSLY
ncbi:MAG: glycosyltransferase family 39 protein, partial [Tannerellaceae bacterium]|nr:glycosyltransferase family 39 protein [Tannerellaceae bacterium]